MDSLLILAIAKLLNSRPWLHWYRDQPTCTLWANILGKLATCVPLTKDCPCVYNLVFWIQSGFDQGLNPESNRILELVISRQIKRLIKGTWLFFITNQGKHHFVIVCRDFSVASSGKCSRYIRQLSRIRLNSSLIKGQVWTNQTMNRRVDEITS